MKKSMKYNYFLIPLFIVAISYFGGNVTSANMAWYKTLALPAIAPPGGFIGIVWTIIYLLSAISAFLFWNNTEAQANNKTIKALFVANGLLNLWWSYIFFGQGLLGWAIVEMTILNLTTLMLIVLMWEKNKKSALLLLPYLLWVSFATYLAFLIWQLN
jgi:tryptophan-rich sensory protein